MQREARPRRWLFEAQRVEARIEAYNAFNQIRWDNPDPAISSSTFGTATRKRIVGAGREIQMVDAVRVAVRWRV